MPKINSSSLHVTEFEPGDLNRSQPSEEAVQAGRIADRQRAASAPRGGYVVNRFELRNLAAREDWHTVATPEPVRTLWDLVEERCRVTAEAAQALQAIPAERQAEEQALRAAVRAELDGGKVADAPRPVDWAAEERLRGERFRQALDLLRRARAEYDAEVAAASATWLAAAVAELSRLREAAAESVRAAQAAVAAVSTAYTGAARLHAAHHPEAAYPRAHAELEGLPHRATDGLAAAAEWVTSSDPVLSGEVFVAEQDMQPSRYERERLARSESTADRLVLADLEMAEGYSRSALSERWGPALLGVRRPD